MDHHGMDDAGMDPPGIDPHGLEPHGLDPQDGGPHGLDHDGGPGPEHGWPEDVDYHDHPGGDLTLDHDLTRDHDLTLGHDLAPDPDLASADTTDLSFAEDYHPGDHGFGAEDPPDAGGEEPLFGADPDLYPLGEAGLGEDQPFPPALDLDPPEPIDGYPWTDPADLGHHMLPPLDDNSAAPDPADLFDYAGEQPPADGDAWSALLASPDPATSALARWWSAG